jgi:hypothetical protein
LAIVTIHDRGDELVQVLERYASIYEAAGVREKHDDPPPQGLEPEGLAWDEKRKIWRGLYAPQWATMIVRSFRIEDLHTRRSDEVERMAIRALKRGRDDEEARRRFVMMFRLCGETAADRRRCVEEFLL